jgi:hypothetical protein
MQRIVLALALLCVPVASLNAAADAARLFLRKHAGQPPQGDDLAELNKENPEAYALVKALLTKRSLGLLNPRHPTASFAAPSAEAQQDQQSEQGPEVFAKFASPGELANHGVASAAPQVAVPYAEVQPAAHHDWMNWKPQNSGMNDEQMVQNVLGAVAELKGKKAGLLSKSRDNGESSLAADQASLDAEEPAAAPAKPVAAPAAPQENSYLKTVDFGLRAPAAKVPAEAAAPVKQENSYLKGLDLSGDMPVAVDAPASGKKMSQAQSSSNNYLASFSWDDAKPKEEAQPQVRPTEPKAETKDNSLASWLGVTQKVAPQAAPVAPAAPANPYLVDLS